MLRRVCDVCGKIIDEENITSKNVTVRFNLDSAIPDGNLICRKDVCEECYSKVKEVLDIKEEY